MNWIVENWKTGQASGRQCSRLTGVDKDERRRGKQLLLAYNKKLRNYNKTNVVVWGL